MRPSAHLDMRLGAQLSVDARPNDVTDTDTDTAVVGAAPDVESSVGFHC